MLDRGYAPILNLGEVAVALPLAIDGGLSLDRATEEQRARIVEILARTNPFPAPGAARAPLFYEHEFVPQGGGGHYERLKPSDWRYFVVNFVGHERIDRLARAACVAQSELDVGDLKLLDQGRARIWRPSSVFHSVLAIASPFSRLEGTLPAVLSQSAASELQVIYRLLNAAPEPAILGIKTLWS